MHKESEVAVNFVMPTSYGGDVFLIMNDNLSEYPLIRGNIISSIMKTYTSMHSGRRNMIPRRNG